MRILGTSVLLDAVSETLVPSHISLNRLGFQWTSLTWIIANLKPVIWQPLGLSKELAQMKSEWRKRNITTPARLHLPGRPLAILISFMQVLWNYLNMRRWFIDYQAPNMLLNSRIFLLFVSGNKKTGALRVTDKWYIPKEKCHLCILLEFESNLQLN